MITKLSLYANAALLILCMALQYEQGRKHKALVALGKAQVEHALAVEAERKKAAEDLARVRSQLPKAGRKVSDAVHSAPSDCSVAPVVGDSLRQAVRQGVAARRGAGAVSGPKRAD